MRKARWARRASSIFRRACASRDRNTRRRSSRTRPTRPRPGRGRAAAPAAGARSRAGPPDTDPLLDEPGLVDMLRRRAKSLSRARVYPIGALTVKLEGKSLTEMGQLFDAGCVAFSQANAPLVDTQVL